MSIELSVILPAYLEEENLRQLLPRLNETLAALGVATEVLVVDTTTPLDNTVEVCRRHQVTYLNRAGGDTFGDAVRTGIAHARGAFVLFMDADGSHPPEFIGSMWPYRNHDVVIASRYIAGGATDNSRILIAMSLFLNLIYSFVLNLHCKDVSNSFKLYRGELVRELTLHCRNFDIVEEILYKIVKNHPGTTIKELPFAFKKRMFGTTKRNLFAFMFSFMVTLCRLRFGR